METAHVVGKSDSQSFYYADETLFIFLHAKEVIDEKIFQELTNAIQREKHKIHNLSSFENVLSDCIKKTAVVESSIASGFLKEDIFYLSTKGEGCIYVDRDNELTLLLKNDTAASGYVKAKDTFLFSLVSHAFTRTDVQQIKKDGLSSIGYILVDLKKEAEKIEMAPVVSPVVDPQPELERTKKRPYIIEKMKLLYSDLQNRSEQAAPRKKITFIVLLIIVPIFVWSVVLGYQRRTDQLAKEKIAKGRTEVLAYLKQAEDAAFFDPTQAAEYIEKAKEKKNELQNELGEKYAKELTPIHEEIKKQEELIMKQENKKESEFFDLSIDTEEASGDMMSLENDVLGIGDKTTGKIYTLSITKKSLDTLNVPGIKQASQLFLSDKTVYYLIPTKGVYIGDKSEKKVVEYDREWGKNLYMNTFNKNIYILDSDNNDIYKYSPIESGFGSKSSYFKGTIPSLSNANSIAIDGSVYIGLEDGIYKFTSGLQEEYSSKSPTENEVFTKIVTTQELDKIYAWNKEKGRILLFGKEGGYVKTVTSPSLTKVQDFVVHNNVAYLLKGNKILSIDLN